ncbi:MAG: DUF366 family protein [Oligoflexia bacterium]|nr:DUF366 family protein [Oligoflexia bacterium]
MDKIIMSLEIYFFENEITYTGNELRPHWISEQTKAFSSSLVSFLGPCDVSTNEMVDVEDKIEGEFIKARQMIHFIAEWFQDSLPLAVTKQRLFIASFCDLLNQELGKDNLHTVVREGNDLYVSKSGEKRKLSVSIVTASSVSCLFHFGVNIEPAGAPIAAIGITELGLNPSILAKKMLSLWQKEEKEISKSICKVLPR